MANALMKKASKALGKSKVSKKAPAPRDAEPLGEPVNKTSSRRIAGLDEDRYYRAKEALSMLSRAEEHKRDKRMMADVRRVAEHEVESLNRALSGGASRRK